MPEAIQLNQIRMDGGTQPRCGINWGVAYDYGDLMAEGVKLPPVTLFYDGTNYWLADGFHRVKAAECQERTEIQADVIQGTLEDAQWYSFGANKSHGLMRSNDDKQRAVQAALKHPKCAGLSDRAIAKHVGVDKNTVSAWRSKVTGEIPQSKLRTGADGRTINTSNIGKAKVATPPVPEEQTQAEAQPVPEPQREQRYEAPVVNDKTEEELSDSHDLEVFRFHLQAILETPLTTQLLADEITTSPDAEVIRELIKRTNEFLTAVFA